MIKFFRKIRRKLIDSGSITKYLLYAVGEILLVVIGILIALQINNWNTDRLGLQLEQVYILNLIDDLENQVIDLNIQKENEILIGSALDRTAAKIADGFTAENISEYNRDLQAITITRTLNLYDATFEDLKSTGNLNLIQNEELKQDILSYFQVSNRYVYVIRRNAEGYHYFIFEDLIGRGLANFDMRGMNEIVSIQSDKMVNMINKDTYPDEVNKRFNERLMEQLSDIDNLQAVKNAVNNRKFTNNVSLLFLDELERKTIELITGLREEIK